jgi:hypothetical protein
MFPLGLHFDKRFAPLALYLSDEMVDLHFILEIFISLFLSVTALAINSRTSLSVFSFAPFPFLHLSVLLLKCITTFHGKTVLYIENVST